eukprot:TRINITY_DN80272_c0_g1_i1.p1 TRINITY_DN80272_c0_g1~~TRINITY_DN80272_c0_g1_i1.p1  ORF type:complete len:319 (+),score=123.20 TRINITY_DN80272_c0_g1_i1:162-1118(+)
MTLTKLEEQQRQAAISLLKRLPPQDLEKNLVAIAKIAPHLEANLQAFVTKPSKLKLDPEVNRYFIACEFNQDGNTHRSPWTNKYIPPPPGGQKEEDKLYRPGERLRRLEEAYNEVFDVYKTSYYEGGVSSVYLWDLDEGFAAVFLIRKDLVQSRGVEKGNWDIVHVVEVRESPSNSASEYKLYTQLLLHLEGGTKTTGEMELGGLFTRQAEDKKKKVQEESHIVHIGRLIEETEIFIRQNLEEFYMAKHREVLNYIREVDTTEPRTNLPQEVEKIQANKPGNLGLPTVSKGGDASGKQRMVSADMSANMGLSPRGAAK